VEALADEPVGDRQRLRTPLWRERRIAVPVDQLERLALAVRRRLAVAHEEQLRAAGRREKTVLAVAMLAIAGVAMLGDALVRAGVGHVHGAGR
jgi:hypothetical protein